MAIVFYLIEFTYIYNIIIYIDIYIIYIYNNYLICYNNKSKIYDV